MHICFPSGSVVKNLLAYAGDARGVDSSPGLGRAPREGNGNPLQYSCLENSMNRGTWKAMVYGVAKSWIQLSTHMHKNSKLIKSSNKNNV